MSFILTHDGTCAGDLNVQGSIILRETTVTSPTETITIVAPDSVTTDYTLVLPVAVAGAGQVLTDAAGDGILSWTSPSSAPSLQIAYNASTSPELVVDATQGALTIKDNATPLGASVNLFEVLDNASGELFGVTSSGVTHTGIVTGGTLTDGTMTTTAGVMSGVTSLSVTDNVTQLSSNFYVASTVTVTGVTGITVNGDYIYSVAPTTNTLHIHKTTPFNDDVPVSIVAKVDGTNLNDATHVIHDGTTLFVAGSVNASTTDAYLVSYNVEDPTLPVVLHNRSVNELEGLRNMIRVDGCNVMLTPISDGKTMTFDITDNTSMFQTRQFNTGLAPTTSVDIVGNNVYFCGGGNSLVIASRNYSGSFMAYTLLDTYAVSGLLLAEVVKVQGNYAYIGSMSLAATAANGVYVVDISNPKIPVKIGSAFTDGDTLGEISDMIVSGNYLYVLSGEDSSLHRIDISDPTSLVAAGKIAGFSGPSEMVLSGGYIYVANATAGTISKVSVQAAQFPQISVGHLRTSDLMVTKDASFSGMVDIASGMHVGGGVMVTGNISSGGSIVVRNEIIFYGTSGSNTYITLQPPATFTAYAMTLPNAVASAGQVLTDAAGNGVLSWASAAATLQDVYDGSGATELVVDGTRGALTIQDNATPLGANLFEIQNNSPAEVFGVTVTGMTHTGTVTTAGIVTSGKGAVTQTPTVTTGVTTNARSGKITTVTLTTGSHLTEKFTVTNSECAASDIVLCSVISYTGPFDVQCRTDAIGAGSFDVVITNPTGGALNGVAVIGFMIV